MPSPSPSQSQSPSQPRPKSRPTASCLPCRTRKVKCNRQTPCTACTARNIPQECKYAAPDADRQAIAQAEVIADLRAKVRRLRGRLASSSVMGIIGDEDGDFEGETGEEGGGGLEGRDGDGEEGEEEEEEEEEEDRVADLEAVYQVLRDGEWGEVQRVVGRLRAGEAVGGIAKDVWMVEKEGECVCMASRGFT
ncbi:hypothetical protein BO70DRAFT_377569 [Aspergillus heteromorphus CBS 117.55]|uniref:Zn(2)-C6 fungal-type domain-containing protein n=1 Tax=Aspergillus heteromorphus CBS 117.55 TaxID=1448321 RepID=A0A317WTK8_9EURO|nr:uncharacterized protein BO70DRAFT_377569 [Aspergillus heteromorphus CBS 117.55]PWY89141.1 hypothetical protein BO70DRAFT_377569 [Aspergillus heteromorphus CBS 117.55]